MPNQNIDPNPFQPAPGANPPLLVGRSAEMASVQDAADRIARQSAPVPMVFLGLRGLGKTVLLNEVRKRTSSGLHLHIEVETGISLTKSMRDAIVALQGSLEPFHKRFGKAFVDALRCIPKPSFELPHDLGAVTLTVPDEPVAAHQNLPLGQALKVLNDAAAVAHTHLVVTVDEVQDVDISGFRSLVACVHQSAGSRSPILLASAGLPEAVHVLKSLRTYAKRWDRFDLDFLTRAETAQGIRIPIETVGSTIDEQGLDLLVTEAAGYPFFIQRYASAAWNEHRGKTITAADAQAIIPRVRAMVEKLFYADEFDQLTHRERLFCKALADLGSGPHELGALSKSLGVKSSAISSIRTNLIAKGIVYAPGSGTIAFRMPLADRYVREHQISFFNEHVQNYWRNLRAR